MRKLLPAAFALPLLLAAQTPEIRLVRVAAGLVNPVDIRNARDGSNRLFFVQQNGVIRLQRDGALAAPPFLDIRAKTRNSSECGLLGMAFPPPQRWFEQRHFYVNYTNPGCTVSVIARYRLSSTDAADPNSEEILLTQSQPFSNHNGGSLAFGPDGFLYAGFGDGGSGGDPQNNGQNNLSILGKLLRIDTESGTAPYAIPASNPFVGNARYRPEIWATGLRNPWRISFDRETGDLWIGDVGQNRAEEIDFQPAASKGGENYGWRLMEGLACFNPSSNCDRTGLTLPVLEYTRNNGDVSVSGGYVYRGARWPGLRGTYLYADYATGRIWGIRREGAQFVNRLLLASGVNITAFGEDEAGEMYLTSHSAGEILRIEGTEAPRFTSSGVVNAASFEAGLTPGSAATVFAAGVRGDAGIAAARALPLPRELDGVKVTVNGREAPLFAVANVNGQEQVNFQTPWETEAGTAQVAVSRSGTASAAVAVPVTALQPGVFEWSAGEAIVVRNAGNTLVTPQAPLRRGELVYLYATGLGPVDANPGTGNAGPRAPLAAARMPATVTIDGAECEVLFAGLAPDFAGVYQVNLRVAQGVRGGAPRDLIVSAGGARSKTVKISVE